MIQNVRYLQWQHAVETTNGLLKTRRQRGRAVHLLPQPARPGPGPDDGPGDHEPTSVDRQELTEDNFQDTYDALVGEYDLAVPLQAYPDPQLAQGSSPSNQSGATGQGQLYLNKQEDAELNTHLPTARNARITANIANTIAGWRSLRFRARKCTLAYWGIGLHANLFSGQTLGTIAKLAADISRPWRDLATRTRPASPRAPAGYQRRAEEWTLQANLAARELRQIGRQIIASLIAEQVACHDYATAKKQVEQAKDIQAFLQTKFTNTDFYTWMQSDLSGLYYQYYRFACDTARKAEQTMKQELMRPELDATQFIQYNYWDSGHQGLLSGEALYLDIKRMELAYHDSNKRELELTRHVSLRQLDPLALLALKVTGSCTVTVPEWLYDLDGPGHYHPPHQGPGGLHAVGRRPDHQPEPDRDPEQQHDPRLAAARERRRTPRDTTQDDGRFLDSYGSTDVIVTSGGTNDSGMFETNLRDERFLPFEGAGAISTWNLSLPARAPVVRLPDDLRRHPAHPVHRPGRGRPAAQRRRPRSAQGHAQERRAAAARRCCSACATTSRPNGRRS